MTSSHLGRVGTAVLVTSTVIATTIATSAMATAADPPGERTQAQTQTQAQSQAEPAPVSSQGPSELKRKLKGLDRSAQGRQTVFVQLSGSGSADVAQASPGTGKAEVQARRADVTRQSNAVLKTAKGEDTRAARLYTTSNAIPGLAIRLDDDGIQAVAARSDVVKVSRITPKHLTNANAAALTRALDTWKYAGNLGKGVKIGVIDSGLDYTHKDFGGPGTVAAYDAAKAASTSPTWRAALPALGKAKVAGGFDFVGDDYYPDATLDDGSENPDYNPVATPDTNPLDCEEHGTHVAGSAAGYGVTSAGATFTGSYASLTKQQLLDMKVGPGMAPAASLYALKVFGCEGSTTYDLAALDWALDPNQDGDFSDHLDIVNLSLGSDDTPVDDPENAVIDELTRHGVLTVASAGNNGDLTDTGGVPANAVSGLSVASSVDSYQLRDGLKVDAPSNVAGITPGQVSDAYDWASNGPTGKPVSGTVVTIPGANADGCEPFSAADKAKVKGKVVWLEWDDDDTTRRCGSVGRSGNAEQAGAKGAIFTSGLDVFNGLISGDDTIPVFQLTKAGTDKLRASATAGTLKVTFDGKYRATIKDIDNSISDTLADYSSRGVHGSLGVAKPDVTAPGDTIASAGLGSGSGPLVLSGTSMSAPVTTGITALVRSRHPSWSPLLVKAAVMNTATHDLFTGRNKSGRTYGPNRVGAGRVDALAAVSTPVLAFSPGADNPVTASFGVVPAPVDKAVTTKTLPLTVVNKSTSTSTYRLSYDPVVEQPGVSYPVSPASVTLQGKSRGSATVTLQVRSAALRHTIDPTMETPQQDLA
ncbi:MAG: S8 family serine peptidase, partial [Marmoricola sp.]